MDGNRSIGTIVADSLDQVREIFSSEVRLAKVEIREEAIKAGKATAIAAAAGLFSVFAVIFLLWGAVRGLLPEMPDWAVAVITGMVVLLLAGTLGWFAYKLFSSLSPKPERTIETMKENVQWAKKHVR